jgi:hypothetical protein|tara:strand:- start:295 stop:492 length:198 start_codon:yes stop_codon:yes gene_type:complete
VNTREARLEQEVHLILQRMGDLKNNDLSHVDKRLTKLEVASKFHSALLLVILASIIGFGLTGLSL